MSIVLRQERAVFLHIPKTGGSWVRTILEELGLFESELKVVHKHASREKVLAAWHGPRFLRKRRTSPPFTFRFVRHPLSWYESWFKYQSSPSRNWKHFGKTKRGTVWHPIAPLDGLGESTFDAFIRNCIEREPGFVSRLYELYDDPEHSDFVGRQENLHGDLLTVLRQLDFDVQDEDLARIAPVNVSSKSRKHMEWNPELRQEMIRLEQPALDRYGYDQNPQGWNPVEPMRKAS